MAKGQRGTVLIIRGTTAFLLGVLASTSFQVLNHQGARLEDHKDPFEISVDSGGRPRPSPVVFTQAEQLHAAATATLHDLLVAGSKRRNLGQKSFEEMCALVPDGVKAVDKASANFEKAAAMDKSSHWSLMYNAFLWGYLGKIDKAIGQIEQALERAPAHQLALQMYALLLEGQGFQNDGKLAEAHNVWTKVYDMALQNTYIGEDWWQHGSSWFDIDVKGKGRYDQTFHTRMTGDVIRITVLNHFFPSEYQIGSNQSQHMLQRGWIALKRVIPKPQLIIIQDWYRWLEEIDTLGSDLGPEHGGQAIRRTGTDERIARHLYGIYAPIIGRVLGRPVKPSYSFMGLYYNEADLKPHRDNTQCEYTLSIQTDFRPADTKYPIYICEVRKHSGQYWQESCSGNETEISAEPGDAVLLMGRFHTHRRNKLPKGAKSMSIFLHWVNIEYEGELKAGGRAVKGFAQTELLIPQPAENWGKYSPVLPQTK